MAAAAAVLLTVTACSSGKDDTTDITVFAAASLTDAFEELGHAFEKRNPEKSVEFNFAGSSSLREQVVSGAPADIYASADEENMAQVVKADTAAADPRIFARNQLEIAVPKGNPGGITGLADFANKELLIGLCAEEVPCGKFGREAMAKAGVEAEIDTNEPDVRSLLTKIDAGELDAGLVYHSDVVAAGGSVEGIALPADQNVIAVYPIVTLADATADNADAFVDFVLSAEGQDILASHGFEPA